MENEDQTPTPQTAKTSSSQPKASRHYAVQVETYKRVSVMTDHQRADYEAEAVKLAQAENFKPVGLSGADQ